ncbi:hypothetical protein [Ornithinimicrobium sp. W1665]|uniref:hypothetical protein n=1 Tax=Ornithinimicrobium sp. W1665 TaxID=3416666 RepID=UPI003CFA7D07
MHQGRVPATDIARYAEVGRYNLTSPALRPDLTASTDRSDRHHLWTTAAVVP